MSGSAIDGYVIPYEELWGLSDCQKRKICRFFRSIKRCLCFAILACSLFSSNAFGNVSQGFSSIVVDQSQSLRHEQKEQNNNSRNVESVGSCGDGLNRIPIREPTHDFISSLLIALWAAFFAGFKLAKWISQKQIDKLREMLRK